MENNTKEKRISSPIPSWMRPYAMIPWKLLDSNDLDMPEKMVLMQILKHLNNETEIAFPTEEGMAKKIGINRMTVSRAVDRLSKKGYITYNQVRYKSGKFRHNVYRINTAKF